MGSFATALDRFRAATRHGTWRSEAQTLLDRPRLVGQAADDFATYWIEGGRHVRSQIADDRLLVRLLRHALQPYDGGPVTLYRGENRERWEAGRIGLAWTPDRETAEMFGRGRNAVGSGGLLLSGLFPSKAIISEPTAHSQYLGEEQFTVDPFVPAPLYVLQIYPPA